MPKIIKLTLPQLPADGKMLTFRAPCNCEDVGMIVINEELMLFIVNADNTKISGGGHFVEGALVSGIVDSTNHNFVLLNDAKFNSLYTYGTNDLEAGTSTLETGKLYFVYE